jgi:hypothetical protein
MGKMARPVMSKAGPTKMDMPACAVGVSGFVNAHVPAAALERYQVQ